MTRRLRGSGGGGSIADAGLIVTLYLGVGVGRLYLAGYLADRFGIFAISIVSLVLTVPALAAFFAPHGVGAVAMLLLVGVLLNVQSAPSVTIVQRMLPRNLVWPSDPSTASPSVSAPRW